MTPGIRARNSSLLLITGLLFAASARAFENAEHEYATNQALSQAAQNDPDIAKFQSLILSWSYGIGPIAGVPSSLTGANPAEQLAHLQNLNANYMDTALIDGGNFAAFYQEIGLHYQHSNFNSLISGNEGSYVLMGSAIHLIEDQASLPHAANVYHGIWDTFEGPVYTFKTGGTLNTGDLSANVRPSGAYGFSLAKTQSIIANTTELNCPDGYDQQCYVFNDQLATYNLLQLNQGTRSSTRYSGSPEGIPQPPYTSDNHLISVNDWLIMTDER